MKTVMRFARRLPVFFAALLLARVASASEVNDPIEKFNRGIFWFNDKADVYVFEPAAKGWDWLMPKPVQHSIGHFFSNIRFPVIAINNLLQGKAQAALSDTGRFAINTTVGVLGFFDPATNWGFPQHNEDFGQTLGVWGVPPGPYLVLPFVGPTNPRDGVGMVADSFTAVYPWFAAFEYTIGARVISVVNFRAQVLDEVREAKRAALDYYVFVRDAYTQRRRALVNDQTGMSVEEEADLYFEEYDDEDE
jgi:phospholipid-binding lipoprotein MlaA